MALQPHRQTQEVVEAGEQVTGSDLDRRLTQVVVEVPYQQMVWRLTQEPVEVPEHVTGSDLLRRLTQMVVEVPIVAPVHPFGEQPFPEYPLWSPAYIQDPLESKEQVYASFFGMHNKVIVIGERGVRIKFNRR
jgi:hypothetical protein